MNRLKRSKDLKTAWKSRKPSFRLAGFPAWDLSNVNGKNYVTSVKDQGNCGSCVSFSTIAALESSIAYSMAGRVSAMDLSEHHLYYCLGARSCDAGWWIDTGCKTAASGGAFDETCMPYSDVNTRCLTNQCAATKNWGKNGTGSIQAVQLDDWDAIKSHIVNYGPISTGFTVFSDFPGFQDSTFYQFTSSYVWPGTKTNKALGGHAVMCYGFDDNMAVNDGSGATGVLFCKNSWGTTWGASGHFKIAYGADGIMSGLGDTYGFKFVPAVVPTTTVAPAPQNTLTTDAPVEPTVAPVTTEAPPAPPTTATATRTATRTQTRVIKTTSVPQPVRGLMSVQCSGEKLKISCAGAGRSDAKLYLNVTSAFYGRDVVGVNSSPLGGCSKRGWDSRTQCGVDQTALWSVCNGFRSCYARVSDRSLGSSGCPYSVSKLARVYYDCLPASSFMAKYGASFKPKEDEKMSGKIDA